MALDTKNVHPPADSNTVPTQPHSPEDRKLIMALINNGDLPHISMLPPPHDDHDGSNGYPSQLPELRSEEVNEILNHQPAGIIRYGLSIIALIGLLVLLASWFIKYPEVIKGSVVISTQKPPIKIISRSSGIVEKLLIQSNQKIKKGDFLAEIENTTHLENLPVLQTLSAQLKKYLQNSTHKVPFPAGAITFGDLQSEYNALLKNYQEAERLLGDAIYRQRKRILSNQISDYQSLVKINERQLAINQEEFINAETKYQADIKLYQERVYGKLDFLNLENAFLQKKKEKENYAKVAIENSLTLSERQKQLMELDFEYTQKARNYQDNMQQSIQNIDNLLAKWQQNYVITAPTDGTLSFLKNLTENQAIRAGDTLFVVVPAHQSLVALAQVPAQNFGKVKVGQQVIIKLQNYPFEEYGSLLGRIQTIDATPMGNYYRIRIQLPQGLTTNYQQTLSFVNEMPGSAEIVTDDMRLFDRIFYGLRKTLNKR
jgi:HlyD family type I secretion membrane fusion protein